MSRVLGHLAAPHLYLNVGLVGSGSLLQPGVDLAQFHDNSMISLYLGDTLILLKKQPGRPAGLPGCFLSRINVSPKYKEIMELS